MKSPAPSLANGTLTVEPELLPELDELLLDDELELLEDELDEEELELEDELDDDELLEPPPLLEPLAPAPLMTLLFTLVALSSE